MKDQDNINLSFHAAMSYTWYRNSKDLFLIRAVKSFISGLKAFCYGYTVDVKDSVTKNLMTDHSSAWFSSEIKKIKNINQRDITVAEHQIATQLTNTDSNDINVHPKQSVTNDETKTKKQQPNPDSSFSKSSQSKEPTIHLDATEKQQQYRVDSHVISSENHAVNSKPKKQELSATIGKPDQEKMVELISPTTEPSPIESNVNGIEKDNQKEMVCKDFEFEQIMLLPSAPEVNSCQEAIKALNDEVENQKKKIKALDDTIIRTLAEKESEIWNKTDHNKIKKHFINEIEKAKKKITLPLFEPSMYISKEKNEKIRTVFNKQWEFLIKLDIYRDWYLEIPTPDNEIPDWALKVRRLPMDSPAIYSLDKGTKLISTVDNLYILEKKFIDPKIK